jgi:hypothetical protein
MGPPITRQPGLGFNGDVRPDYLRNSINSTDMHQRIGSTETTLNFDFRAY